MPGSTVATRRRSVLPADRGLKPTATLNCRSAARVATLSFLPCGRRASLRDALQRKRCVPIPIYADRDNAFGDASESDVAFDFSPKAIFGRIGQRE